MIPINKKTDAIPGTALMTPSTTRRKRGAIATMHNIRKTLKDCRTDRLLAAGTSKTVIIKKSKIFHLSQKNLRR